MPKKSVLKFLDDDNLFAETSNQTLSGIETQIPETKQSETQIPEQETQQKVNEIPMQICSKCKIEKPYSEYHKCKANKNGIRRDCKECKKNLNKETQISIKKAVEINKEGVAVINPEIQEKILQRAEKQKEIQKLRESREAKKQEELEIKQKLKEERAAKKAEQAEIKKKLKEAKLKPQEEYQSEGVNVSSIPLKEIPKNEMLQERIDYVEPPIEMVEPPKLIPKPNVETFKPEKIKINKVVEPEPEQEIEPEFEPEFEQEIEPEFEPKISREIKQKFEPKIEPKIEPKFEQEIQQEPEPLLRRPVYNILRPHKFGFNQPKKIMPSQGLQRRDRSLSNYFANINVNRM